MFNLAGTLFAALPFGPLEVDLAHIHYPSLLEDHETAMPINNEEQLHGAAFLRLLEAMSVQAPEIKLSVSNLLGRNFYLVTAAKPDLGEMEKCRFGIVIKISNKRRSPWRYTYTKENQDELAAIFKENGEVFSIYVAGEDGFAV